MTNGMTRTCAAIFAFAFTMVVRADDGGCPVGENVRGHENTEWSIAYAFHLIDDKKDLPRVLLVGDSICSGYQEGVRDMAEGKFNVSYWISSYCLTSPEYLRLLAFHLDAAKYDVVHFNNGLHSLKTDTASWAKALKEALALIRAKQPQAKIVWVTSTPLKDAKRTAKAKELNAAAVPVVESFGDMATNDLFALLDPLDRETNWSDVYHHKPTLRKMEAARVFASVSAALAAASGK